MSKYIDWVFERLSERSTWAGIRFICALFAAKYGFQLLGANLDWGDASSVAIAAYSLYKMIKKGD